LKKFLGRSFGGLCLFSYIFDIFKKLKEYIFSYIFDFHIWKARNDRLFKDEHTDPYVLVEKAKLHSFLWVKAKHTSFNYCYYDWWKHPILCLGIH